jgi:hypothetical protein
MPDTSGDHDVRGFAVSKPSNFYWPISIAITTRRKKMFVNNEAHIVSF